MNSAELTALKRTTTRRAEAAGLTADQTQDAVALAVDLHRACTHHGITHPVHPGEMQVSFAAFAVHAIRDRDQAQP